MIDLKSSTAGILLPVRAQPGSRRNEIAGIQNGALKVAVTQVAEKGKANRAVLDVLAKGLNLRKSQVELASGDTARDKVVLVTGVTVEELQARIEELVGQD